MCKLRCVSLVFVASGRPHMHTLHVISRKYYYPLLGRKLGKFELRTVERFFKLWPLANLALCTTLLGHLCSRLKPW